jgi:acetyl-CoA carboxylase biotin carboxyl carrier protein
MVKKAQPEGTSKGPHRGVDLAEVERLLEFMQKHRLEQFEYERDGIHILLKKAPEHRQGELRPASVYEPGRGPSAQPAAATVGVESAAEPAPSEGSENLHVIKSPIVGTFYAAPGPEAEPFVTVGARVKAGQVLCIIEAMKLMNEIEADLAGEVAKIFPENGNPVEYGEPLFSIRPSGKK